MSSSRFAIVAVVCVVALVSIAAIAQSKGSANGERGELAYSSRANWLTDSYDDASVLRDRAATSLRQLGFDVELTSDAGLKATRRDPSFGEGSSGGGSSLTVTCEIKKETGTGLILHRVLYTADGRFAEKQFAKHPFSGIRSTGEQLELAQARVAQAIATKPEAVIELNDADSLRPYIGMCITLKGRTSNQKDGVFMSVQGVSVELPNGANALFNGSIERDIEWTGTLRFVSESMWYKDPNEDLKPGEGHFQSRASHQTPVRFRLDP